MLCDAHRAIEQSTELRTEAGPREVV